jgi:DNA (cytosine-5)-methyltransferase 1
MTEIIVDSFAGGGGASTGIELALGRSPDIAINHDATALAMHQVNHPETVHLTEDIWAVDPREATAGRPVGLLWASPDCKHFSKAKGGKPVSKNIRSLAWVVVHWANVVAPRVIILENVEEFATWGPLGDDGRPCPLQKGAIFERWTGELARLGYTIEWRELRACDYGAPTIRKRLFLIARRDGAAIVWPQPTHGDPKSEAVKVGRLKPWRTAAEIIDWSLPCPSIFDTAEEIMMKHGRRAVRPLQSATMARLAKGVRRYVVDAAQPFIVNLTHHGEGQTQATDDPLATVTAAHRGEKAIVAPFVTGVGGRMGQTEPRDVDQPAQTLTAKADSVVVTPFISAAQQGGSARPIVDPLHTVTASRKDQNQVIAPHLTKFHGGQIGAALDDPAPTVTSNSFIKRPGGAAPLGIAAAFMAQHNYLEPGHDVREPVSTIVNKGPTQAVVAANLLRQFGTGVGSSLDEPTRTVMADGQGKTQLAAAFLQKYYKSDQDPDIGEPLHTATVKARFGLAEAILDIPPFGPQHHARARQVAELLRSHGLWDDREFVTLELDGITLVIVDLGMRMFIARELFRAQGFPDSYIIDRRPDGSPISKTDQVSKCGNSVCPPIAAALVAANVPELSARREAA